MKNRSWMLIIFNFASFLLLSEEAKQIPWSQETVKGISIDQDKVDYTEGFGAFLDLGLRPNTQNFDNGGGSYNFNTTLLNDLYGVKNVVYDPYQRSEEENRKALE